MKNEKVTDLEEFALKQIYRPYQTMLGIGEEPMKFLNMKYHLHNVLETFKILPEWEALVMDRILRIGFIFPAYINHPLVDYIREEQKKV